MKFPILLSLVLPAALYAAPPADGSITKPDAAADSAVVARVGESDVRIDEVRAALAKLDVKEQDALSRDPALLNQVVRLLLVQRLMLREATDKKWQDQPKVRAQIDRARDSAIADSYLQSVSEPPPEYPAEAEIAAAYEAAKPSLTTPKQWLLAQIYIACPPDAPKADVEKAQARLEAVKKKLAEKNADFAAIAKAESDEKQSAAQGGQIGWMAEGQIQPEIRTDATKLAANELSSAVRLKDGWHILKCLEIKEAATPTLDQVRVLLAEKMRAERSKANSQAYIAKLLQENPLAINEIALSKVLNDVRK